MTGAAPVMSQAAVEAEGRPALAGESRAPLASWDLTRILLAVVGIGGLIVASLWIVSPFLPAVIWATMIVVATWPMLRGLQARLWGRRSLAVAVQPAGGARGTAGDELRRSHRGGRPFQKGLASDALIH